MGAFRDSHLGEAVKLAWADSAVPQNARSMFLMLLLAAMAVGFTILVMQHLLARWFDDGVSGMTVGREPCPTC